MQDNMLGVLVDEPGHPLQVCVGTTVNHRTWQLKITPVGLSLFSNYIR